MRDALERKNLIYKEALAKWGYVSQILQLTEEIGELLSVINKHQRLLATKEDIIEELVDVKIMLGQLQVCLNISDEHLDHIMENKLRKLESYLTTK
jgi:NTP pyrophosphatase (non-canonical NTP hydrolase)